MAKTAVSHKQKKERPYYTEEHMMFRDSLRKFLEKECLHYFEQWEEERLVPREFWRKMGESGFLCPSVSEEYGGAGGDFGFSAILSEERGEGDENSGRNDKPCHPNRQDGNSGGCGENAGAV